jgi:hypothetical protein
MKAEKSGLEKRRAGAIQEKGGLIYFQGRRHLKPFDAQIDGTGRKTYQGNLATSIDECR